MGFSEILTRLPRALRALRTVAREAKVERPDVAVVIDYPEFHFRLARRLKSAGVPVVYYIPPKIWVWRRGRIRVLREVFARVLFIFPFERELYARERLKAVYVGNPLIDELPLGLTRQEARARLGLPQDARVLVLMPGSRPSELGRHVPLMSGAAKGVARRLGERGVRLQTVLALPATIEPAAVRRIEADSGLRVVVGEAHAALVAADAGLIKSGTSTLEAALLGCPHAVVYRTGRSTSWIFRNLVRYRGPVGLVNLVGGPGGTWRKGDPYVARELLLEDATETALAEEALALLTDPAKAGSQREAFARIRGLFTEGDRPGEGPSVRAAREVLAVARERRRS